MILLNVLDIIDLSTVIIFFVLLLVIGYVSGKKSRNDSGSYFISKGKLSWWVIGAAYVATGLNSEQLIGMNGMGYMVGLPLVNSYLIAIIVFTALITIFFPLYLRNGIVTMPQYLGLRFDDKSQNVFSVLLLLSYIFLSLAVVLYGGAKLFEIIFNVPIWFGTIILGLLAGLYTIYGGMQSMVSVAFFQFVLMFIAGGIVFLLGYWSLPNGWEDIVTFAPGGFHLMQPMDTPVMPWHAVLFALFNLQLFYACINQALVQRGFGAKTEWDVRMAIVFAGAFVLFRPFLEIFPGMIARALYEGGDLTYKVSMETIDNVFPMLITNLVPKGLKGLILIGILGSVMSTISAFLNSISTLFTYDVYKKWIHADADDKQLVKVGIWSSFLLMIFSILYAPLIGKMGGIFIYFQSISTYLAVPVATCFLFGMFWKRTTPIAALFIMVVGIPLCFLLEKVLIPGLIPESLIVKYNLTNFYVIGGIAQIICVILIVSISLLTTPRNIEEIKAFTWSRDMLRIPVHERGRPWWQSVWFWWGSLGVIYGFLYYKWW